jgi:hypothetical protein
MKGKGKGINGMQKKELYINIIFSNQCLTREVEAEYIKEIIIDIPFSIAKGLRP